MAWTGGFGWLFQWTAKKKNACPQHLLRNSSERQKASACPYILVQGDAGNSGSSRDLYCLKNNMGLFSSSFWQGNCWITILPDMERSTELSFQTILYSKAPGWGKVPLSKACLWWTWIYPQGDTNSEVTINTNTYESITGSHYGWWKSIFTVIKRIG